MEIISVETYRGYTISQETDEDGDVHYTWKHGWGYSLEEAQDDIDEWIYAEKEAYAEMRYEQRREERGY
jgi:hypothetical protein